MKDQREMSSCSGLAVLDHANSKFSRGYSCTGVGMGVCARHEFVQPNGVVDLQAGECYANMDWLFSSIVRHLHIALRLMVSYDIACQWAKNLRSRLEKLPPMLRLSLVLALIRFVVPKLHIHGHTLACQLLYSLNWVPGSGQTDGEGIERPWSMIGGVAASTRVSGPGARADILDDHWSFWNWKKLIGLPTLLRKRLDTAIHELARQQEAFQSFSSQQADNISRWKAFVEDFEADGSKPNPYQATVKGATEAQVRTDLDRQDEEQQAAGIRPIHDITPNSRRALNKRIDRLRILQATYTPASLQQLADLRLPQNTVAEKVPLLPPSVLTTTQRMNGGCVLGLVEMEKLHIKYRLLLYKRTQSHHQKTNTRSRTLVTRNEYKILLHSWKYQAAHSALVAIAEGNTSEVSWPCLHKDDIRCLEDSDELAKREVREKKAILRQAQRDEAMRKAGIIPLLSNRRDSRQSESSDEEDKSEFEEEPLTLLETFGSSVTSTSYDGAAIQHGESRRTVSWIWSMTGRTETNEEMNEALRIEWAKAWARVHRWTEEVAILTEEWRPPVQISSASVANAEGLIAYAVKQADIYQNLQQWAEAIRTEPKLQKGVRQNRPGYVFLKASDMGLEDGDGFIEDDTIDESGNFDEEELLMAGVDI
ncbi:CxC2 domain-containing protein [Mycena indigotica]|uniref:CxC2 domain-containing protein n=1 Tax=Mycena indigotica TaxID=2126181 RepID=A0A8H6W2Q8_9AGAR|nr:CxC2 domain-containing protein [Mycena indigotica]KAF7299523.1 CxC2 domain-containing protein [Mycena indigotica]